MSDAADFDAAVQSLRGKVVPKRTNKPKAECTPEEWAANLDKMQQWEADNPGKSKERSRKWRASNPEKARSKCRAWRGRNPDKHRECVAKWRKANPSRHRQNHHNWRRKARKSNPYFRMMENLRDRQRDFFKGRGRSLSMVRNMGCDREFFLRHIESQFTAGMTMENYGTVWHLDHIYPLSKASIVDNPIHFLAAANWRNLQPMLGPENSEKNDAVTPESQVLFDDLCREFSQRRKEGE